MPKDSRPTPAPPPSPAPAADQVRTRRKVKNNRLSAADNWAFSALTPHRRRAHYDRRKTPATGTPPPSATCSDACSAACKLATAALRRSHAVQKRSSECLVRGVVLDVALGGGAAADGAGAGGVPDLDQVLERDPGVVAAGLVPVVAGVGGQGLQGDDQVRAAAGGAQPPGAVPAGRPVPAGRGEREPGFSWAVRVRRVPGDPWVRAGRSRARWRGRPGRSRSRTTSSSGSARPRRPGRGPATGRRGRSRRARRGGPRGR